MCREPPSHRALSLRVVRLTTLAKIVSQGLLVQRCQLASRKPVGERAEPLLLHHAHQMEHRRRRLHAEQLCSTLTLVPKLHLGTKDEFIVSSPP